MLRALTRNQSRLLALLLVLACLWSATLTPAISETDPALPSYPDMVLYHDIAAEVRGGQGYYETATRLQRAHHFPTRPFVTVREPTLTFLAVTVGWEALQALMVTLLLLASIDWYRALGKRASGTEKIATGAVIALGGAMATQQLLIAQHELWAGVLLTPALLFRGGPRWPLALILAAAALALRELALPFALLALAFAVLEKRRNEAIGWAALIGLFAIAMLLHANAVNAFALPTDLASQGWNGMRGPGAVLQDLVDASLLNRLPGQFAYPLALLALLGWSAVPLKQARFALLWFLGYALMLALFARAQNFYWVIVLLPAWFIGFAFLPRAIADLGRRVAGTGESKAGQ